LARLRTLGTWGAVGTHPLAGRTSLRFEQTLSYEHVGLPPAMAVYTMLQRPAARAGRTLPYRVVVSNFDAALRAVAANLGVSVIPRPVAMHYTRERKIRMIKLTDAWAGFAVCYRDHTSLQPAAEQMLQFLASKGDW